MQQIKNMGIFFWRDVENAKPIVLRTDLVGETVFYSQGIMDEETWEIDELAPESLGVPNIIALEEIKQIKQGLGKREDMRAWVLFNTPRTIQSISRDSIRIVM